MAKQKPPVSQADSMCLPERSIRNDQFLARPVLALLSELVRHDCEYCSRDWSTFDPMEFGWYWSEVVGWLQRIRELLPINPNRKLITGGEDLRCDIADLDKLIDDIWFDEELGKGQPGDDCPQCLMKTNNADLLKSLVVRLTLQLNREGTEATADNKPRASDAGSPATTMPSVAAKTMGGEQQKTGKRPGINARMLEAMQANPQKVMGWSSARWARHLTCVKSSIASTPTWKDLMMARERVKAERAVDRRRKPKASDQNRTI
ncbi:MAG: hypothetical protein ACKV2Q_28080 [Planctomycetaceae bacterium]